MHPRRAAHRTGGTPLATATCPVGHRRDDPLAPPWVIRAVAPQATAARLAPSLLLAVAWRESGFATTATPGNGSTAAGMFQFNEDAWLDAIRIYGPKHGLSGYSSLLKLEDSGTTAVSDRARRRVLDLRRDVRVSAAMAAETMVGERRELEDDLGRPTRPADLYLRHLRVPRAAGASSRPLPRRRRPPATSSWVG